MSSKITNKRIIFYSDAIEKVSIKLMSHFEMNGMRITYSQAVILAKGIYPVKPIGKMLILLKNIRQRNEFYYYILQKLETYFDNAPIKSFVNFDMQRLKFDRVMQQWQRRSVLQ